jgi:transcriptional regulator with XRE-family HTH domain
MTEQIKLIAERIKELREISGTSVETLAKDLGIPKELFLQYESGNIDIPVGFLSELAQKFNIGLSSILSGEEPKLHVYTITRKDKGISVDRRRQYKYESLAQNFIHKKAEPFIVRVEPSDENAAVEFNSHPGQEFDYVIEGTLKIIIDNHDVILNEGDSIYFDSSYKHALKALNNKTVKTLVIVL